MQKTRTIDGSTERYRMSVGVWYTIKNDDCHKARPPRIIAPDHWVAIDDVAVIEGMWRQGGVWGKGRESITVITSDGWEKKVDLPQQRDMSCSVHYNGVRIMYDGEKFVWEKGRK